jgi:hypothetical protein
MGLLPPHDATANGGSQPASATSVVPEVVKGLRDVAGRLAELSELLIRPAHEVVLPPASAHVGGLQLSESWPPVLIDVLIPPNKQPCPRTFAQH